MEVNKKVIELQLDDVLPNRFQPRIKFNEDSLNELCESIKEHGVIQPIVVRPVGDKYEIIAGERRYKASSLAGKTTIPAIITDLNDKDSAEVALIENVQRQNLTPIEEAISYKKILDMGYLNQTTLAEKLGKNQSTIANKLRLLDLDDEVQEALLNSKISERHARSLLRIQDKNIQVEMLNKIINERMTVRKTDEEIDKVLNSMNNGNNNFMNNMNGVNNNFINNMPENSIIEEPIPENNYGGNSQPIQEPLSFESLFTNDVQSNFQMQNNINESPVINDNPFEVPEQPIESIEFDTQINPGFVNVEKIVEEAQPVSNNINSQSIDMDKLVSPYTPNENPTIIEPNPSEMQNINTNNIDSQSLEPTPEEQLTPKKFFNILDESETQEEKEVDNIQPQTNVFNFDNLFQETSNNQQNVLNNQSVNQNYSSSTSNEFSNVPGFQTVTPTDNSTQFQNNTSTVQQPNMDIKTNETSRNFEQAIQVINECASKLEQLGYKQEHDDFDLEDMYQVIFRIEK